MSTATLPGQLETNSKEKSERLRVVLCGSFRRSPRALREAYDSLRATFDVLSPKSVDFVDPIGEYVRLPHELEESVEQIEARHLSALRASDFIWLFCPDGYVGHSASLEIGYAHAIGLPVFAGQSPTDPLLGSIVEVVDSFEQVPARLSRHPGAGLARLQQYYARVAEERGWERESPRDTLLLLVEEVGELAHAVRKNEGLRRDDPFRESPVGSELADVQLYLVHLANALGIDLASAVTEKEEVNAERFARRPSAA